MKKVILVLFLMVTTIAKSSAQIAEVKVNLASATIGIFNPSIELGFCENSAITMDYVGAYAKFDYLGTGMPFLLSMVNFGYRHYLLNKNHNGLFLSGDLGLSNFKMIKSIALLLKNEYDEKHYDVGHGTLLGVTAGYKLPIKSSRWLVEFSASFGWQLSWHEGYVISDEGAKGSGEMSKSGEWLPYKGGIYLSYRLFK